MAPNKQTNNSKSPGPDRLVSSTKLSKSTYYLHLLSNSRKEGNMNLSTDVEKSLLDSTLMIILNEVGIEGVTST